MRNISTFHKSFTQWICLSFLLIACSSDPPKTIIKGSATSISPDSRKILSFTRHVDQDSVFVTNVESGNINFKYELNEKLSELVFLNNDSILVQLNNTLFTIDLNNSQFTEFAKFDSMNIMAFTVDAQSNRLIWGNAPENIHAREVVSELILYDLKKKQIQRIQFSENFGWLFGIAPMGKDMFLLNLEGELKLLNIASKFIINSNLVKSDVSLGESPIQITSDKKKLVTSMNEGGIYALDLMTKDLREHNSAGKYIYPNLSPDNRFIVAREISNFGNRSSIFSTEELFKEPIRIIQ